MEGVADPGVAEALVRERVDMLEVEDIVGRRSKGR